MAYRIVVHKERRPIYVLGHKIRVVFATRVLDYAAPREGKRCGKAESHDIEGLWDPNAAIIAVRVRHRTPDRIRSVFLHELTHACHSLALAFDPAAMAPESAATAVELGMFSFFADPRNRWAIDMVVDREAPRAKTKRRKR